MQADGITQHTGTPSAAATTYHIWNIYAPSAKRSITPTAKLYRRRQGERSYRLNLNELMDVAGMGGGKDVGVGVAMVMGRV